MHPVQLTKAINGLIFNHPFFASLLLKQKIVEDNSKKTFSVNGTELRYNRAFCESLSHDENMGVLAHEMLHLVGFHHARAKGRNLSRWNKACDYAINPIVKQAGFVLPEGALLDSAFAGKTAEEIYRLLPAESEDEKGKGGNSCGEVEQPAKPDEPNGTGDASEDAETKTSVQVAQAVNQARAQGKLPAFIDRAITQILPRIDWRETLAQFVRERVQQDHSWNKPSRRFLAQGMILPSLDSKTIGNVIFACDTSGSISASDVSKFAAELLNALQTFEECGKVAELTAIYCDAEVQGVETLTPDSVPSPKGGGGTDFKPPFAHIAENALDPVAVVYMTDGHCNSFPDEPAYPVLWAVIGNYHTFKPPFGEVLLMDINS